jgi:hypothetical protein
MSLINSGIGFKIFSVILSFTVILEVRGHPTKALLIQEEQLV